MPYRVHVRNTPSNSRGTWATYVEAARARLGVTKAEFGRRIGVDRGTVHRWATGQTRPGDGELLHRFAEVLGYDLDEVLAAAGLKVVVEAPTAPTREADPELEAILLSGLDARVQQELIRYIEHQRDQDRDRRLDNLRTAIRLAGGKTA